MIGKFMICKYDMIINIKVVIECIMVNTNSLTEHSGTLRVKKLSADVMEQIIKLPKVT